MLAHLQVHSGISAPQRRLEGGLSHREITGDGNNLEAFPTEVSEHFQGSGRVGGGKSPGSQQTLCTKPVHEHSTGAVFFTLISLDMGDAQQT